MVGGHNLLISRLSSHRSHCSHHFWGIRTEKNLKGVTPSFITEVFIYLYTYMVGVVGVVGGCEQNQVFAASHGTKINGRQWEASPRGCKCDLDCARWTPLRETTPLYREDCPRWGGFTNQGEIKGKGETKMHKKKMRKKKLDDPGFIPWSTPEGEDPIVTWAILTRIDIKAEMESWGYKFLPGAVPDKNGWLEMESPFTKGYRCFFNVGFGPERGVYIGVSPWGIPVQVRGR